MQTAGISVPHHDRGHIFWYLAHDTLERFRFLYKSVVQEQVSGAEAAPEAHEFQHHCLGGQLLAIAMDLLHAPRNRDMGIRMRKSLIPE